MSTKHMFVFFKIVKIEVSELVKVNEVLGQIATLLPHQESLLV